MVQPLPQKDALKMIREMLSQKELYRSFLMDYVVEERLVEPLVQSGHKNEAEILRATLEMILLGNADLIDESKGSSIEHLFYSALNLIAAFLISPFFLRFTPSKSPVAEYAAALRDRIENSQLVKKQFLKLPDSRLEEYKEVLDSAAAQGVIDARSASELQFFFFFAYDILNFQNAYHMTIQPKAIDVKVKGRRIRPDLLVWLPHDDNFRLIVECDGFMYHSSKEAFTNDRQRDRALKSGGYDVFRFSGQEIYGDPISAASDLLEYLHQLRPYKYVSSAALGLGEVGHLGGA